MAIYIIKGDNSMTNHQKNDIQPPLMTLSITREIVRVAEIVCSRIHEYIIINIGTSLRY